jgi:hypothetical protein
VDPVSAMNWVRDTTNDGVLKLVGEPPKKKVGAGAAVEAGSRMS